jgi:hypothetical protein
VEILSGVAPGHEGDFVRFQLERRDAAGFDQRNDCEWGTARPEQHGTVGITERSNDTAAGIDFHDVPAMDARLEVIAKLANQDRWNDPLAGPTARGRGLGRTPGTGPGAGGPGCG